MTLGELIAELEKHDPSTVLADGFGKADSWRGHYCEIAFAPASNVTIGSMLAEARYADGKEYSGYKGGDYVMDLRTPCNVAMYGEYGGEDDVLTTWRLRCMLASAKPEKGTEP